MNRQAVVIASISLRSCSADKCWTVQSLTVTDCKHILLYVSAKKYQNVSETHVHMFASSAPAAQHRPEVVMWGGGGLASG